MPISKPKQAKMMDLLVRVKMFDQMSSDELHHLSRYMSLHTLALNEVLFEEGESSHYLCFIVEGAVQISKQGNSGESTLAKIPAGRMVGEMSLFDKYARSATARAIQPTSVAIISQENVDKLCLEHPAIGVKVLKGVARIMSLNLRRTSMLLIDR